MGKRRILKTSGETWSLIRAFARSSSKRYTILSFACHVQTIPFGAKKCPSPFFATYFSDGFGVAFQNFQSGLYSCRFWYHRKKFISHSLRRNWLVHNCVYNAELPLKYIMIDFRFSWTNNIFLHLFVSCGNIFFKYIRYLLLAVSRLNIEYYGWYWNLLSEIEILY